MIFTSCILSHNTGDQWFDETQFESYRKLGETIAKLALKEKEGTLREALDKLGA